MSRARLQAVPQGEPAPDEWLVAMAQAALTKALAQRPTAMLIAWEGRDGEVHFVSVPGAVTLAEGMAARLFYTLHADIEDGDV
jgi:hypothetical protein